MKQRSPDNYSRASYLNPSPTAPRALPVLTPDDFARMNELLFEMFVRVVRREGFHDAAEDLREMDASDYSALFRVLSGEFDRDLAWAGPGDFAHHANAMAFARKHKFVEQNPAVVILADAFTICWSHGETDRLEEELEWLERSWADIFRVAGKTLVLPYAYDNRVLAFIERETHYELARDRDDGEDCDFGFGDLPTVEQLEKQKAEDDAYMQAEEDEGWDP